MFLLGALAATVLVSCNEKKAEVKSASSTEANPSAAPADLPYQAAYTSNWSDAVSDADVKMVLNTYKDWADNNMAGLESALADTVAVNMANGDEVRKTRAEILNMWKSHRDSLASVNIKMDTWHKMYAVDKKDGYVVVWYDETDNFKTGKVDSASYHDINQVKDGKIVWYSQYKRPKK